jgi:hypothetical protein
LALRAGLVGLRWGWAHTMAGRGLPSSPTPRTGQVTHFCLCLTLRPIAPPPTCMHLFVLHLIPFQGGGSGLQVVIAQLAAAVATLDMSLALPMDCFSYGRQRCCTQGAQQDGPASPCALVLPLLPSRLVGLGHVCGTEACVSLYPQASAPAASCLCRHVRSFPLSSLFGGVATGCGCSHATGRGGSNSGCQLGSSHGLL